MKKIFALILVLVALFSFTAMAEEVEFVDVVFEDGFKVSLPSDWYEMELTEEDNANGIFYGAICPEAEHTMQITWQALEGELTLVELQEELVKTYPTAALIESNGIGFIGFRDDEMDVVGFVAMDATEPGMYTFWFTPATVDEAFIETATKIVASIYNVEL